MNKKYGVIGHENPFYEKSYEKLKSGIYVSSDIKKILEIVRDEQVPFAFLPASFMRGNVLALSREFELDCLNKNKELERLNSCKILQGYKVKISPDELSFFIKELSPKTICIKYYEDIASPDEKLIDFQNNIFASVYGMEDLETLIDRTLNNEDFPPNLLRDALLNEDLGAELYLSKDLFLKY